MHKLAIVDFSTAKDLKELGFDWYCDYNYYMKNNHKVFKQGELLYGATHNEIDWTSAPEQALVCKWFRDVHNIHIIVEIASSSKTSDYVYSWNIWRNSKHGYFDWNPMNGSDWEGYDNFEEAELEGIQSAIEYLKK
jgi:hypothetical protein